MKQLAQQIQSTTEKLEETLQSANQVLREYDQLIGWAEMYDHCIFEAEKMIVAQFVKAVHVRRDYEIDIEFSNFKRCIWKASRREQGSPEQIQFWQ